MVRRSLIGLSFVLLLCAGCGHSNAALAKTKAELAKAQADLKEVQEELQALKKQSSVKSVTYIEELERLDALRTKGVLTPAEFDAKKESLLKSSTKATPSAITVAELVQQLRTLHELYNNSTITNVERDSGMQKLIERPLVSRDLKADLEAIKALYNTSVINNVVRDAINKRILEGEPQKN